jgi:hypothetical protein
MAEMWAISTWTKECKGQTIMTSKPNIFTTVNIKLGMMNNLVSSLDDRTTFQYLQQKFPQISKVKIKEGIFLDPQIMDLMKVNNFDALLKGSEKTAWEAFMWSLTIFLANIRHLTIRHLLNICLQPSELWGATCHSNFAFFTVMGIFSKQPGRCPRQAW